MNNLVELHETTGLFKLEGDGVVFQPEAAEQISDFFKFAKQINEQEKKLKEMLLDEMEKLGVIKISTDEFTVSYIAESDRETLDTKTLKAECPDVYDAYCKIAPVKASVRIKLK